MLADTSTAPRAVVLLSGGVDSTTCLAIAKAGGLSRTRCHFAMASGTLSVSQTAASSSQFTAIGVTCLPALRLLRSASSVRGLRGLRGLDSRSHLMRRARTQVSHTPCASSDES